MFRKFFCFVGLHRWQPNTEFNQRDDALAYSTICPDCGNVKFFPFSSFSKSLSIFWKEGATGKAYPKGINHGNP